MRILRFLFFTIIILILGCSEEEPTVTITSPEDGSAISGIINVIATVHRGSKELQDIRTELYIDDSLHQEDFSYLYEWDTENLVDSSYHTIIAVLYYNEVCADADTVEVQIIRQEGEAKWVYHIDAAVSTPPAVGLDGTIYVGSSDGYLYAFNSNGTLKWRYDCGKPTGLVSLGPHCDIYVAGHDSCLYALSYLSGYSWSFQEQNTLVGAHALASDGTIYIPGSNQPYLYLYALNPDDGSVKWKCQLDDWTGTRYQWFCVPTVGSDGTIYVGCCNSNLYAITPEGSIKWRYKTGGEIHCNPAVGSDGTIYVGSNDHYLYAFNPDSTLKWRFQAEDEVRSAPAVDVDGTIYIGSVDGCLYALNADGTLRFRYYTWNIIWASSPAICEDGTIYIGALDNYLYAITSNGTLKWRFKANGFVFASPAIALDGTVYFGSSYGDFYAIKGSSPLANDAPWPMDRHDLRRTGRAGSSAYSPCPCP